MGFCTVNQHCVPSVQNVPEIQNLKNSVPILQATTQTRQPHVINTTCCLHHMYLTPPVHSAGSPKTFIVRRCVGVSVAPLSSRIADLPR